MLAFEFCADMPRSQCGKKCTEGKKTLKTVQTFYALACILTKSIHTGSELNKGSSMVTPSATCSICISLVP